MCHVAYRSRLVYAAAAHDEGRATSSGSSPGLRQGFRVVGGATTTATTSLALPAWLVRLITSATKQLELVLGGVKSRKKA